MTAPLEIAVRTDHPVASESLDHLEPLGTAQDNSRNLRFNQKLRFLYPDLDRALRVLDLGCAGGGFVRDCLLDRCVAVGIDGSDYSARVGRAEWTLFGGRFLFTADITRPFDVTWARGAASEPLQFDVITSWETFEHLEEADLRGLFENIRRHLLPGGLVIASISDEPVRHHRTLQGKAWWDARFQAEGFTVLPAALAHFGTEFVRGQKYKARQSFHVVATNDAALAPRIPAPRLTTTLFDRYWYGRPPYHFVRRLLGLD